MIDKNALIKKAIQDTIATKQKLLESPDFFTFIEQVSKEIIIAFNNGNKVLLCGNGGSAADAQHIAAEFTGRFYVDREPLFAEALHTNTSFLTAVANDYSYDQVYSRAVKAMGKEGDVLIGISTSGNSKNVLQAIEAANSEKMITIGLTGESGGAMKNICKYLILVPSSDTPRIQESHILIGHIIAEIVEKELFSKKTMKAVIAAGGMGTRLANVAQNTPKALIKIGDKPVIEHQIILLKKHGIEEIHLLLGYLGNQIKEYLGDGKKWGVKLHYHQEEVPLGSAGALAGMADELKEDFLFLYGDIMTDFDIKKFINWHQQKKDAAASLMVHPSDHPSDSDLVQTSGDDKIAQLFLKPHIQNTNLEGLGISSISILSPAVFAHIPKGTKSDFEKDVLPAVLAHPHPVYAYNTNEYIKDMGTPERLEKVNEDYANKSILS